MKRNSLLALATAIAATGCAGGGNVTYIKLAPGSFSAFSGTDCPGVPSTTVTFTGVDGDGTLAIYAEPNSKFFLDLGSGLGVEGTQTGSNYSFNGTWADDVKGATAEVQTQEKLTLTLTSVSGGYTGTITIEDVCQSTDNSECGGGNPLTSGGGLGSGVSSADGHDFDCTESSTVAATTVSGVQQISSPGATAPAGPNPF